MDGLKERVQKIYEGNGRLPPIAITLGMKLAVLSDGRATMTMAVGKKFHNPMGTLHGGIMTDLADATMGIALMSTLNEDESFTTLELKMNFIRPVYTGKLIAEGVVVHRGRTISLVECLVKNEEGKVVARCAATQMILRGDAPLPAKRSRT
jgi:uncharacterized protein (TIGR00369 family)